MSKLIYERVIERWCETTAVQPWSPNEDMHVEINDYTVGLIYREEDSPATLNVFVDLGSFEHADIYRRLLLMNIEIGDDGLNYFAIHPETGNVILRICVQLNDALDGTQLPGKIEEAIEQAKDRLFN